jgi:hypothetical protein
MQKIKSFVPAVGGAVLSSLITLGLSFLFGCGFTKVQPCEKQSKGLREGGASILIFHLAFCRRLSRFKPAVGGALLRPYAFCPLYHFFLLPSVSGVVLFVED